ncbi:DUF4429 domain-containing protein [Yinghuangia seranimata]|uniref:DUF4429 domain-containing protein n=1 Tax=Yinghuangia seranimata TaxID=408067 RepID=UPI00248B62FA|nr:DUF4429 domain-containing protein [Yinghuangia seranimata]MDI2128504.1 DUF4429 domain-containing protein [Yinghuangia seranimata]
MTEVIARDGTWTFDGGTIRIVPGRDRGVHRLRQLLGEVEVPLAAVAGIAYEPGRKQGRLRLRLRPGADPFLQLCGGRLDDAADPYALVVESDRTGVAEYFADAVRDARVVESVPDGPCDRYLLPPLAVPQAGNGKDGSVAFDGDTVRLEWGWLADERKRAHGTQRIPLADIADVEWHPAVGMDYGHLRFRRRSDEAEAPPHLDPNCLLLWGTKKESGTSALVGAAVLGRLPHPTAPAPAPVAELPAPTPPAEAGDPDVILRRLRELGDLRRDGILDDTEFAAAKAALLRRL